MFSAVMLQTRSSSRPRSPTRDRDESASLTFAIAELGSRLRRVDGLDYRDREGVSVGSSRSRP